MGIVVSCGDSGERGWRTELDLGSRKSLDDYHAAATLALVKRVVFVAEVLVFFGQKFRFLGGIAA